MIAEENQVADLFKQHDGDRVTIGMSINEVEAIFGSPLRTEQLDDAQEVRYYGNLVGLEYKHGDDLPFVAVVFKNGNIIRVLGGEFFDRNWITARFL